MSKARGPSACTPSTIARPTKRLRCCRRWDCRRESAIASSICEPTAVAHQAADQRQADLHVEAKASLFFQFAGRDEGPQGVRQGHAAAPHAGKPKIETTVRRGQFQVEG